MTLEQLLTAYCLDTWAQLAPHDRYSALLHTPLLLLNDSLTYEQRAELETARQGAIDWLHASFIEAKR